MALGIWIFLLLGTSFCDAQRRAANANLPQSTRAPSQAVNVTAPSSRRNLEVTNSKGVTSDTVRRPEDPKRYASTTRPNRGAVVPSTTDKRRDGPQVPNGGDSNGRRDHRNEPTPERSNYQKGSAEQGRNSDKGRLSAIPYPSRDLYEEKVYGRDQPSTKGTLRTDTKSDSHRPGVDQITDRDTREPSSDAYIPSERDQSREGSYMSKGDRSGGNRDRTEVDSYSRRDENERYPSNGRVNLKEDSYPPRDRYDNDRPGPHTPPDRDRYDDKGLGQPEPYPPPGDERRYKSEQVPPRKGTRDYDRPRSDATYPVPPPRDEPYPKGEYYDERRRLPPESGRRSEMDRESDRPGGSYSSRDRTWEDLPPRKGDYGDDGRSRRTQVSRDEYDRKDREDSCSERGDSRSGTTRCQNRRVYEEDYVPSYENRRVEGDRRPAPPYDDRRLSDKGSRDRNDRDGERYRPSSSTDRRDETIRESYDPKTSYRSNPATYDETSPTGIGRPDKESSSVSVSGPPRSSSRGSDAAYPEPPASTRREDVYAKGASPAGRDDYYRPPSTQTENRGRPTDRRYDDDSSRGRPDRYDRDSEVSRPSPDRVERPYYEDRGSSPSRYPEDRRPGVPPEDKGYRRSSDISPPRREQDYDRDYRPDDRRYPSPDPDDRVLDSRRSDSRRRDERPFTPSRSEDDYDRRPPPSRQSDDGYERRPPPPRRAEDDYPSRRQDDIYDRTYPAMRPADDREPPPRRADVNYDRDLPPSRSSVDAYIRNPPASRRREDDYDREERPVRRYDDRNPPVRASDDTSYRRYPPDDSYDRRPAPPRRTDDSYDRERPPPSSSEDTSYRRNPPPRQPEPPSRRDDESYDRRRSEGAYNRETPSRRYSDDDYDREPAYRRPEDVRPPERDSESSYRRSFPARGDAYDGPLPQDRPRSYDRDLPSRRVEDRYDRRSELSPRDEDTYDKGRRSSADTYPIPPPDTSRGISYAKGSSSVGREDYRTPSRQPLEKDYNRELTPIDSVRDYREDARRSSRPDDSVGRRSYLPEDTFEKDGRPPSDSRGTYGKGSVPSSGHISNDRNKPEREYRKETNENTQDEDYARAFGVDELSSDRSSEKASNSRTSTSSTKGGSSRLPTDSRNSSHGGEALKGDTGQRRPTESGRKGDSILRQPTSQREPTPAYSGGVVRNETRNLKGLRDTSLQPKYPAGPATKGQEQPVYRAVPIFNSPKEIIDSDMHLRNPTKSPSSVVTEVHYPVFIPQKGEGESVITQKDRRGTIKDT